MHVQAVLMVDRMISPFTLTAGPILFILSLALIKDDKSFVNVVTAFCVYFMWVLFSRTVRMLPHFYRCPGVPPCDFLLLPVCCPGVRPRGQQTYPCCLQSHIGSTWIHGH